MSGHNKWSQIKVQKGKTDAQKSKVFSLYAKIITMEAKKAGGDKNAPGLRAAIERAKSFNVPNDVIDRAVIKGFGGEAGNMEEVVYEGYGPGGVAFIIKGITDNKNRTTQEIKHLLSKNGGNLGAQGSVMWAFTKTADGYSPTTPMDISANDQEATLRLYEELDNHDDIQDIFSNATLSDE
ncbi:MAG: YebC/PmpR family DNA-binding transcriptional regulator [Candidatus Vogelbacteria bacterium]|nr:YebC/PmpR family DNA-binding transcriptional regulator [Candidatus Vogelbacteria bacterium]